MFVADFVQLARQLVESTDLPTILLSPLFPFSSQLHAPISNSTPSLFPSAHPLRPTSDPSIKGTTSLSFLLYSLHLFLPLSLSSYSSFYHIDFSAREKGELVPLN